MHKFLKFIFGIKLYMFRTVPLFIINSFSLYTQQWYRGAVKSLARPGSNLGSTSGTRTISTWRRELPLCSFFFQGGAPKENHVILTETLACFHFSLLFHQHMHLQII